MNLLKKRDYDAKVNEIKSQIPSAVGLASTGALNAVKSEILNFSQENIMMQKYKNYLIIINLQIYLVQR